jgi:hypothetical protein
MIDENMPAACRQVWDRAVEGRDVMTDPTLAAHVGSCVTCFRTLAELRDVPRLAATLRASAPAVDAEVDARFWDDLADRTTRAAAAALRRPARNRAARVVGFVAIAAAAAAAVVLVAGRTSIAPSGPAAARTAAAKIAAGIYDEATGDDPVDVADLDESALRRLLARLRARAPRNVAALAAGGDVPESTDVAFDDDGQMNDELADLDGAALLRLEHSLAGASL